MQPITQYKSTRREMLQLAAAGGLSFGYTSWLDTLASRVSAAPVLSSSQHKKAKACILIWLSGGPSHKDMFDLKPQSKGAGDFKPIATSAPGIQISEHLPKIAKLMNLGVLLRGMSTLEGAHPRASFNLHTGYREGQGGVVYPSLGSLVSSELGKKDFAAPNYVAIGPRSYGSGFLGPKHQPLQVAVPARGVEDLKSSVQQNQFDQRVQLLEDMEKAFYGKYQSDIIQAHKTTYHRAVKLMESKQSKAFDISLEPQETQSQYGKSAFGQGCLMARRLIEASIPFVEVSLGGWDTHNDNFARVKTLSATLDQGMSALILDLKNRGLLSNTLVVCMGEFGRTPNINNRGAKPGRDHYPRAWSMLMMGAGVKHGMVYGKTDSEGASVVEGKMSAMDFMATVCTILGIDITKEIQTPIGRPIRIVDKTAKVTHEIIA